MNCCSSRAESCSWWEISTDRKIKYKVWRATLGGLTRLSRAKKNKTKATRSCCKNRENSMQMKSAIWWSNAKRSHLPKWGRADHWTQATELRAPQLRKSNIPSNRQSQLVCPQCARRALIAVSTIHWRGPMWLRITCWNKMTTSWPKQSTTTTLWSNNSKEATSPKSSCSNTNTAKCQKTYRTSRKKSSKSSPDSRPSSRSTRRRRASSKTARSGSRGTGRPISPCLTSCWESTTSKHMSECQYDHINLIFHSSGLGSLLLFCCCSYFCSSLNAATSSSVSTLDSGLPLGPMWLPMEMKCGPLFCFSTSN